MVRDFGTNREKILNIAYKNLTIMADTQKMKEIQLVNDPDLVVLRNPVAKARFHLSVYQTKFLLEVLSHLKSKPEARILTFDIRQFNRTLDIDNNDIRYYVNEIRKMVSHVVSIPMEERNDGGIRLKEVALIAGIDTDINGKGEGNIKIEVADMIKPYFLEIANGQFFSFNKYNSRVLKGRYSINLYMLLKSYQRFRTFQINFEELRDILEIKLEEYRPFKEFKRWVLEKSRKEMLEKNDIYFDYEVIRATSSQKSNVTKIVFYIINNPNHAAIYREFQLKEGKIKESNIIVTEIANVETGENSELLPVGFFEQINTYSAKEDNAVSKLNTEILSIVKLFEPNIESNILVPFVESLQTNGFSEERIVDVLLYAQERRLNGEKIRNIFGYLKHGLESGTMGIGLAKHKKGQEQTKAENTRWDTLFHSASFETWLQNYYINKGINADNDVKLTFMEAAKKIPAMMRYFDNTGRVIESEKDIFRASLGKKLANTEGVTPNMLFIQFALEVHGVKIKKVKDLWKEIH